MLQLILIIALIVEICVYVAFGMYWRNRGYEWLVILPALGVVAVGLRLLMALPSFMLSGAFRIRDNQQQPWGNALYALAKEIDARAVSLNFSEIFHQLLMPQEPAGSAKGMPILLVHGYFSNRGMWWRFRQRLANADVGPIYTITLSPLWGSIDEMVPQLVAKIETICTQTGHEKLIVVAHSMGGLVTRAYMTSNVNGSSRIAKLITLATPHHGTQMANFGIGQCVGEMQMKSGWLAALERGEENIPHPNAVSIYTLNDDLVYPPENCRLAWAENIPVAAVGHVGLLFSKAIAERVISEIKK
jgi:triacylglycerol lipase